MRRDINDRKTPHRFVGLVSYCKILMILDMQSAPWEVAFRSYRNRTYSNHFVFVGRVSLKNTPLNPSSDSNLAGSII